MFPQKDFVEFIELFNIHEVEFLVVGAFAIGHYARPRETSDMDLWVNPSLDNQERIWRALQAFGITIDRGPDNQPLMKAGDVLQLGFPPVRIDLLAQVSGVSFDDAWNNRESGRLFDVPVFFIGYEDLRKNKLASGRRKDIADLRTLDRADKARQRIAASKSKPGKSGNQ